MYHHVELSPIQSNYRVSAARFDEQLHLLHDWGYQTISTSMLVSAIQSGAQLPPRPVIITFDDDDLDVYTVAFPIMQKYGFSGVAYVPYDYIGGDGYMSREQLLALYNAGWEVGSHSMTHRDLNSLDPDSQRFEIVESRQKLEALLGIPVLTFAYPFGVNSNGVVDYVRYAGYIAGMGATGFTADQGISNLYVLQRCEIKETDVVTDERYFARFLPWWGDPPTFPTNTPAPTNTPKPTETPLH
jgi:peptidoglycan/xylan/chitin deacetylase (PgdA/CDA1 family)